MAAALNEKLSDTHPVFSSYWLFLGFTFWLRRGVVMFMEKPVQVKRLIPSPAGRFYILLPRQAISYLSPRIPMLPFF